MIGKDIRLRPYQESCVAVAIQKNTLVILPTGLGKTMIALFVAAYRLSKKPDGKVLFLAPTKPLVEQHYESFNENMSLDRDDFAVLTGAEDQSKRKKAWDRARIIFATPQTIENDILSGNIDLSNVVLTVFDEAHRAVGEYAYVFISKKYREYTRDPLSLALTASPGSSKEKIDGIVANLGIDAVEIRTEKDYDVREYVESMQTEWVRISLPENFANLRRLLTHAISEYIGYLKERGYLHAKTPKNLSKKDLLELQSSLRQAMLSGDPVWSEISDVAALLKLQHGLELLETQGIGALENYLKRLLTQKSKAVATLMKRDDIKRAMGLSQILKEQGVEHPKIAKLRELISAQISKKRHSKIIVFSQYRDTVEKILSSLEGEKNIAAKKLIGQSGRGKESGMSQKAQKELLSEFNGGVFNVLVSTSVGEEGLDIDEVDLVMFYEPVPSEIRTIQRRGRTARKKPGRLVVLITLDTRDEVYFWASFHKERRMKAAIRDLRRDQPKIDRGQASLSNFESEAEDRKDVCGQEILVYVDQRERNSGISKRLDALGARVIVKQLKVADFLVSDRACVERKSVNDFLQSIVDGRLMSQISEMCRNFERPILVLEGTPANLYTERNIHPNAIRGTLASIAVKFGVPIVYTTDPDDTAAFLYVLAKREQENATKEIALRGEKRAMSISERQQFIVESLPNVSAILAKRLLAHFGSVEKIFLAKSKELQEVEGLGIKKAKIIRDAIRSEYIK